MAGDWIKMRVDLDEDPAVIGVSEVLGIAPEHTVGCLWKLWKWANLQTVDGDAPSVTEKWIDRYVCVTGFARALEKNGWLVITDLGIEIPNFERHNGKSAKERALAKNRMSKLRSKSDAPSATPPSPEKRREEKKRSNTPLPPLPDLFAQNAQFVSLWENWIEHRRQKKCPVTAQALKEQIKRLSDWGLERALKALSYSIANGWTGVFEEGQNVNGKTDRMTAAEMAARL